MNSQPETTGASRCDVPPCILTTHHAAPLHEDRNGYTWPTAAAERENAELIEHARSVGMVEPEKAPAIVAAFRAYVEQQSAAVSPPTVPQLADIQPAVSGVSSEKAATGMLMRVRTDALLPGDRVWHPYDMAAFTVSVAPEALDVHLGFHNKATGKSESGMRVTGVDDAGWTVHVDAAQSHLWRRAEPAVSGVPSEAAADSTERYPTLLGVSCDHCSMEWRGDFVVSDAMTKAQRLDVVRDHVRTAEGWQSGATGDFCPNCAEQRLPHGELCTDPTHTGPIRAQLGCTGPDPDPDPDPAAVDEDQEQRPAWLTGAEAGTPAPITAADVEPPLLDPFAEAAVRRGALLGGADAIEALPQDYECDPGRGDAVKLLRRLAGLTTTTEQPAGLTWEARADHAVRLYATTAIELEDARRDNARLRAERDEVIQQRDRISNDTMAALTAAEQRDNLDFNNGNTLAAVRDALLDTEEHTPVTALAAARVLLAAHARYLSAAVREQTRQRNEQLRAEGARSRVSLCTGMHQARSVIDDHADALDPQPTAEVQPPAAVPPLRFPQLTVPCPRCKATAGQLCTSHNGTRQRTADTHQDRTRAYRRQQAGR
ncbi:MULTISPECIES: zinc finger domain-containing protein [unclassified Streptomyces]|uniref:zinc finger domain-containing protein n=1 Tax=Streptomyces sp. NPDC055082 TaxID=3365718 RepID=UPI0037D887BD